MQKAFVCAAAILSAFALSGCDNQSAAGDTYDDLRMSQIEERLAVVEATQRATNASVVLRPTDEGFAYLDSDLGRVRVSIDKVAAFGNGSEVTLLVGNPTGASFLEMKAPITWGATNEAGQPIDEGKRSIEFSSLEELKPSAYRRYAVKLSDVPPSKLGWVRIGKLNIVRMSLANFE